MNNHEQVSDQVFHVLVTLADGPRHGYGIIQEVEARTAGELKLGSGTLYSAIKRMRSRGWVERIPAPEGEDPRRKYYGLTEAGRALARTEARRLAALVRFARGKDLLASSMDP
jgi:DNA-binding PadR family transcriptional regulator